MEMTKLKMILPAKNVIFLILTMLLFLLLSACSRATPEEIITENLQIAAQILEEADYSNEANGYGETPAQEIPESVLTLAADEITDILFEAIPALNDIAVYIDHQSLGKARLVVQAFDLLETDYSDPRYPVYIGEEWEDGHRVNWYSLSVSQEIDDVRFEPYNGSSYKLEKEWEVFHELRFRLIEDALSDDGITSAQLDSWIGDYSLTNPDKDESCTISIFKLIDKYYAKILINSGTTTVTIYSKIQGNENSIDFIFLAAPYRWSDDAEINHQQGEELFNFTKNNEQTIANWNDMDTLFDLFAQQDTIELYTPEADESYYNASINTGNSIEIDDGTFSEVQSAYNDFLNGKNYFEYNNQPYYISDVMTQPEYSSRRYTLYDMNDDGIPELVLDGQRLYVLSYNQGKLITLLTDQHTGGSYSLVNNGYLYYRHGGIANQTMHCYEKINSSNEHVRYFSLFRYVHPDYDNDSWYETYTYLNSEDDDSHEEEISEAEYEEWVKKMSNDDEIDWQEFYFPKADESTAKLLP